MALADTGKAIGKVTELLSSSLKKIIKDRYDLEIEVSAGRPEPAKNGHAGKKLNLFLYESLFDPCLKNISLDEGQPAPLWLVLKYLLTAFDDDGESDTAQAHEYLGEGIRALQELNFLFPDISAIDSLGDNPEPLKITFDETPSDLLSKLMQGSDEKYRFSVGFQVRPVMIALGERPSYSLLVGIDYTKSPLEITGEKGVIIPVIPSMGPVITSVSPSKYEANAIVTIYGSDLNVSGLSVMFGRAGLAVTSQQPDKLQCRVNGAIAGGGVISAGSHPVAVVQTLPEGRNRSSNLLIGNLLPSLTSASVNSLARVIPADPASNVFGNIVMSGLLLGSKDDDIFVALYKDGKVMKLFDGHDKLAVTTTQTTLALTMKKEDAVPPGNYRVILRINGQQAKNSPEVSFIV
ncbi:MAG: Pvc16 family protein [Candidatus Loosdrechtia sp.]|uniref:Pvc16 family protein n=1 Tax=Candidatus Loosdrechtia sp. TaxID=3101272 RepID=UPI003A637E25|nr:MAG: Pvc16 family protein [Candidatus Jettenia sp. AMX2]